MASLSFGAKVGKTKTQQATTFETTKEEAVKTTSEQEATKKAVTDIQQTQFSEGDIAILRELTSSLAGQAGGLTDISTENILRSSDIAAAGAESAIGFQGNLEDIITGAKESATLAFERGELSDILTRAQDVGSLSNTNIQLLLQQGGEDLATRLAAIEGDLRLKGVEVGAQQQALAGQLSGQAISAAQAPVAAALQALQILKGAETTGKQTQQIDELTKAIQELIGTTTETGETATTGVTKSKSAGFSFGI